MSHSSAAWVEQLERVLARLHQPSPWGLPPSFPFEKVQQRLQEALETSGCLLTAQSWQFLEGPERLAGLGTDPLLIPIEITPLQGNCFLALPSSEMEKLLILFLTKEGVSKLFTSQPLSSGFSRFFLLKVLHLLNEEHAFGDLTLQFAEQHPLPPYPCYSCMISLRVGKESIWARILCTEELFQSFKDYFSGEKPTLAAGHFPLDLSLDLPLQVGSCQLSPEEWEATQVGDLLLLDHCSYSPSEQKGTGKLLVDSTALFEVRLKEGETKILEQTVSQDEHEETSQFFLRVEAARLSLPLQKILDFQGGEHLESGIHPERLVTLTLEGRPVAKGELIQLGEAIGVKILSYE